MEFANRSLFSFPCLPLCSLAAGAVRRPPTALGRPRPNPTSSPLHVAPPRAPGPTSLRAGASAASPRHPAEPSGRHRDTAVARAAQHSGPPTRARPSIWRTRALYSMRSFTCSPLRKPRTPPPPPLPPELGARRGQPSSALPRPKLTPPLGPPRPRAAPRPHPLAQPSPENPSRRRTPPPTRLLRRAAASEPLPAPLDHPEVCLEPEKPPHPSTLAAGEPLAGKRLVNRRLPSLTGQ